MSQLLQGKQINQGNKKLKQLAVTEGNRLVRVVGTIQNKNSKGDSK